MFTSETQQRITLDSPPPSPVPVIQFQLEDNVRSETGVSTPARRKRSATVGGRKKQKIVEYRELTPNIEAEIGEAFWDDNNFQMFADDDRQDVLTEECQKDEADYAVFVNAVLAEECPLYQLTKTMFIVNGWDPKAATATVSI